MTFKIWHDLAAQDQIINILSDITYSLFTPLCILAVYIVTKGGKEGWKYIVGNSSLVFIGVTYCLWFCGH